MSTTPRTDYVENGPYPIRAMPHLCRDMEIELMKLRAAINAFMDRCESTQGQAFYDRVKPEWETLEILLSHERMTPFGVWKYDRKGVLEESPSDLKAIAIEAHMATKYPDVV